MFVHAKVAKLYKYLDDNDFSRVLRLIEASMDEGLDNYELEVDRLDDDMKFGLIDALEVMGYGVTYEPTEEMLYVKVDNETT